MVEHAEDKTVEDSLLQVTRQTTPLPISTQMKMKRRPQTHSRQGGKTVWLMTLHDTNLQNRNHHHLQKGQDRLSARPSLSEHHESTTSPTDPATANTKKVRGT